MILAIVQARMASTRLPGKVMKEVEGKPLIGHLLERLKRSKLIDKTVLATSIDENNDPLEQYVKGLNVEVFRGSEEDTLDRVYQAALEYQPDTIVRITGDCPLIDPEVVDKVIEIYRKENADYASNAYPSTFPDGLDTEVFSFSALKETWEKATLKSEREHVTPYIRSSGAFKLTVYKNTDDLSSERWVLDQPEDLKLIKAVYANLYPEKADFTMEDVLMLKKIKPDIFEFNKVIQRNEGYAKSLKEDKKSKNIIIRADASERIGSGHVMRTIALGQMLQDAGFDVHYVTIPTNNSILDRLKGENFYLHTPNAQWDKERDLESLLKIAGEIHAGWIITDGYHFDTEYQKGVKSAGHKLLCVDDIAECHYAADVVINQNIHAVKEMYAAESYTKLCLGPAYSLIRKEFFKSAVKFSRKIEPKIENLLVTMGGADQDNVALKVLSALNRMDNRGLIIKVVCGALNPHVRILEELAKESKHEVVILESVGKDMPELMKWAQAAITAGGSILWEYALFSTPVMAVTVAKNQEQLVSKLGETQTAYAVGWHSEVNNEQLAQHVQNFLDDIDLRQKLSENFHNLVKVRKINDVVNMIKESSMSFV